MSISRKISRSQLICINVMLNKLGFNDQKDAIVASFTNNRTTSRAALTMDEATAMIKYLKSEDPEEKKAEVMRRKIISLAHEMNWRIPNTKKVDMRRIDDWAVKYGHQHKKLNQYLYHELPMLVSQFEEVYKSLLKAI